jgi:predicted dehydrogenase
MGAEHYRSLVESSRFVDALVVVDPDPRARARFSELGAHVAGTLSEIDLAGVELAVVSAPTKHHLDIVAALSAENIRCLVEKPCALRATQFQELIALESRAVAVFRVGLWRRFSEPFLAVKDLLGLGAIGAPRAVLACQWDAVIPDLATQPITITGGIGLDCGIHETDTIAWLGLGHLAELTFQAPQTRTADLAAGDVDQLLAQGRTDGGVAASISLSRTAGGVDEIFYKIIGERGSIELRLGERAELALRLPGSARTTDLGADYLPQALRCQLAALDQPEIPTDSACFSDAARAAEPWLAMRSQD